MRRVANRTLERAEAWEWAARAERYRAEAAAREVARSDSFLSLSFLSLSFLPPMGV